MSTPESPILSIGRQDWSFRRRGKIDEGRHNEKVKEAIINDLPTIISDGNIITADPNSKKAVRVPLKSLELPRLRHGNSKEGVGAGNSGAKPGDFLGEKPAKGSGQGDEAGEEPGQEYYEAELTIDELQKMVFDDLGLPNLQPRKTQEVASDTVIFNDVRKKRTSNNLDIYRTMYANMERNATERGVVEVKGISPDDFRVKTWQEDVKEQSSAVVLAMADISGSMGSFEKYVTRAFSWWTVGFLRHKYPKVDIVFIAHDTNAYEVTEQEFFSRGMAGGTKVSSANELALDIINTRYTPEKFNIYPLHFSDGDNWGHDNERSASYIEEMLQQGINQYSYIEIGSMHKTSELMNVYNSKIEDERFNALSISSKEDILPALKKVFPNEQITK